MNIDRVIDRLVVRPDGCVTLGVGKSYSRVGLLYGHRVIYEHFVGPIAGLVLHHVCRNKRCVRPDHLTAISQGEHVRVESLGGGGVNRAKTHCPRGHAYGGDNLIVYQGRRYCRACHAIHNRAHRARLALAGAA